MGGRMRVPRFHLGRPSGVLARVVPGGSVLLLLGLLVVAPSAAANSAPVANAGDDQETSVGRLVFFGGKGSTDPDGDSLRYSWDFDASNGISEESTLVGPTHTYSAAGAYTVTLTVSDGFLDDNDTVVVTVHTNRPPVIIGLGDPRTVYTLETVYFDGRNASDPDGDTLTYSWDFDGDGKGDATDRSPSWKYTQAGTYAVRLTVSDGRANASANTTITVIQGNVIVSAAKFDESATLTVGRERSYELYLRKNEQLSVTFGASSGKANLFLFTKEQYFAYLRSPTSASAVKKGTFFATTAASYTYGAPSGDSVYVVVQNPTGASAEPLTYSLVLKKKAAAAGGVPGMEAGLLVPALVVAAVLALVRRRDRTLR